MTSPASAKAFAFCFYVASLAAVLIAGASAAHAGGARPQPGMWAFDGELDGQPGRSLHIDTQLGRAMIVSYLGYRADGSALFLQASGVRMTDDAFFAAPLQEFRNGPVIAGRGANGDVAASLGDVELHFDSPSSGTIKLPGDVPRRISRFVFTAPAEREIWFRDTIFSLQADPAGTGRPREVLFNVKAQDGMFRMTQLSTDDGRLCTYAGPYQVLPQGLQSEGTVTCIDASGPTRQQPYRIDGLAVDDWGLVTGELKQGGGNHLMLGVCYPNAPVFTGSPSTCAIGYGYRPIQPGMWSFDDELDGRPGRSLQIDVQDGNGPTVVSYVGYRSNGESLFLQGVSSNSFSAGGRHAVPLREFRGGPVLGGPVQTGQEAATLGEARFEFDSPTTGTVTLPSEGPRRISRYRYEDHAARFDKLYEVQVYPLGLGEKGGRFLDILARNGVFRMDKRSEGTARTCRYHGAYRLTGEGLASEGQRTCTDSAEASGATTTDSYRIEQLTVDENGVLRAVVRETVGYYEGTAIENTQLYLGSCPGFTTCPPAGLEQPR